MLIIPSNLESLNTLKDGTIKLVFETQELRPEDVGVLFSYRNKLGFLIFKPETFDKDQLALIEKLKVEEIPGQKSNAQRMRNILYRLWQEDSLGYADFNLYYEYRMNDLCDILKTEFKNKKL
jgi:hypothetical protein